MVKTARQMMGKGKLGADVPDDIDLSQIKNKQIREEAYQKLKHKRNVEKLKKRKERKKMEKEDPTVGPMTNPTLNHKKPNKLIINFILSC